MNELDFYQLALLAASHNLEYEGYCFKCRIYRDLDQTTKLCAECTATWFIQRAAWKNAGNETA